MEYGTSDISWLSNTLREMAVEFNVWSEELAATAYDARLHVKYRLIDDPVVACFIGCAAFFRKADFGGALGCIHSLY